MTTLERFQEVLKPIINIEVNEQTTFCSMRLDALDLAYFVANLEDEFQIEIEDDKAESFQTVGECLKYIDKKVAEKGKESR